MSFILNVLAWLIKNSALLVGIVEAIAKAIAGIVSITPTKKDDFLIQKVDEWASLIKKALYTVSDYMAKKPDNANS